MKIGVVILAAGASERLGRPKQLLRYKGKSLIRHSIAAALGSSASSCMVVLGAGYDEIVREVPTGLRVKILDNQNWKEGMSSSIRAAIGADPGMEYGIFMVADQPFIESSVLDELIDTQKRTGKPIVVCEYDGSVGTPAMFHRSIFPELLALKGDHGAKKVVLGHPDDCAKVPFPKGKIDIDTEDDYARLI
ncbi:MAG TPA: nucleotidyltransferase family protein [Puia sp.]|nr:nucleotidyltransferase family protein [Puia sp.]